MATLCPEPPSTTPGCSCHDLLVGPPELVFPPGVQGAVCMHLSTLHTRVQPAHAYAVLSREQPEAPHHWVTSAGFSGLSFFLCGLGALTLACWGFWRNKAGAQVRGICYQLSFR